MKSYRRFIRCYHCAFHSGLNLKRPLRMAIIWWWQGTKFICPEEIQKEPYAKS